MGTLKTTQFTDNEIAKAIDFNFTGSSAFDNLAIVLKQLLGPNGKDPVIKGFHVQQRSVPSMNVDITAGLAFCLSTETFIPNPALAGPIPFEAAHLTLDRYDMVQIRRLIQDNDVQQRAFKDPVGGAISYQAVPTKSTITTEFMVKKGTAAALPVAPTVDAGWTKLSEVRIRANATTILDGDIHNITAKVSGEKNREWTVNHDASFFLDDISQLKAVLEQLGLQVVTDEVSAVSGTRKLLIYYAYPSVINNSFSSDLSMARSWLALYDVIVISNFAPVPNDDPRHSVAWDAEYAFEASNVVALIGYYHQDRPDGEVFMYIPIGRAPFTAHYREYTDAEIQGFLDWFANTAHVDGVFYDEAGWDYGVSRTLQNNCKEFAKRRGLRVFWNSWRPDDCLNAYIVQKEWQSTGVLTHYLYSAYTAGNSEIEVWVGGVQYARYTGGGDPPAGQFKEDTSGGTFKVIVNKNVSSYINPWTEIRNKRGNASGVGGNMTGLASLADSDDYWLHESMVSEGNYNNLTGDGVYTNRYGWEINKWMYYRSDRAIACRDLSGCRLAAVSRCDYADMFTRNDPGIMAGSFWNYKWTDILPEPLIEAMLGACYAWAILYSYDTWGHQDSNFAASSAKTFPFSPPKLNLKSLGVEAAPVHLDGPPSWGAYAFQAVHTRAFQGGKLFLTVDGRPLSYRQPVKFMVLESAKPTEEYVGADLGLNARFFDGLTTDQIARRDKATEVLQDYHFLKNLTLEGIPTFRQLTGDHRYDDAIDAMARLVELSTGDCSDDQGEVPEGNAAVFEPSFLGQLQNPAAFQYNGKSAAAFGPIVNVCPDPDALLTSWVGSNASRTDSDQFLGDYRMAKITYTLNNGTWGAPLDFSGAVNLTKHGVSIALRRGNDSMCWIILQDNTAVSTRLKVRVEFATRRCVIESSAGYLVGADWLDSDTVVVRAISLAITKANVNVLYIEGNLGTSGVYYLYAALACVAQDQAYPVAFANGTRPAMKSSFYKGLPAQVTVQASINPWFKYDDADEHCLFNWVQKGAEASKYLKLMWETFDAAVMIIRLQFAGYVPCVSGDIGKVVTGATTGATGTLISYDNTNRYWKVRVTSGAFSAIEAVSIGSGTGAGYTSSAAIIGLMFVLKWKNGGTERTIESNIFDNGANFASINKPLDLVVTMDLSLGTSAGVSFWINGALQNAAWSGAADTIGATVYDWLHAAWNGTNGYLAGLMTRLRVFSGLATQDDVNEDLNHLTPLLIHEPEPYSFADQAPSLRSVMGFWNQTVNVVDPDLTKTSWTKSGASVADTLLQEMGEEFYKITGSGAWGYAAFPFSVAVAGPYYLELIVDCTYAANFQVQIIDGSYANKMAATIVWATKVVTMIAGTLVKQQWLTDKIVKLGFLSVSLPMASGYQVVFTNPAATDIHAVSRVCLYADGIARPWAAGTREASYQYRKWACNVMEGCIELDFLAIITGSASNRGILTDARSATLYGLNVYLNGTTLTAVFRNTAGTPITVSGTIALNVPHHVKLFWSRTLGIVGMNIDNTVYTSAISTSYSINFQDNLQLGNSPLYGALFTALDGYLANVYYRGTYDAGNLHAEKGRPWYSKTRLIGRNGNWLINVNGAAFFNTLKVTQGVLFNILRALNGKKVLEINDNGDTLRIDTAVVLAATKGINFEGQATQLEPFLGYARYKP